MPASQPHQCAHARLSAQRALTHTVQHLRSRRSRMPPRTAARGLTRGSRPSPAALALPCEAPSDWPGQRPSPPRAWARPDPRCLVAPFCACRPQLPAGPAAMASAAELPHRRHPGHARRPGRCWPGPCQRSWASQTPEGASPRPVWRPQRLPLGLAPPYEGRARVPGSLSRPFPWLAQRPASPPTHPPAPPLRRCP